MEINADKNVTRWKGSNTNQIKKYHFMASSNIIENILKWDIIVTIIIIEKKAVIIMYVIQLRNL